VSTQYKPQRYRSGQDRPVCPTCSWTPANDPEIARLREELETVWWSVTDQDPGQVSVTRHCGQCQPHTVYVVACRICGDGPILAGQLAKLPATPTPSSCPRSSSTS
jgi:hypothetical protein